MHIVVNMKNQATIYFDPIWGFSSFAIGPLEPQRAKAICEEWLADGEISGYKVSDA